MFWQTTILHRIEETWKLWQKFHDEFIKFDGFLSACEKASRNPKTHGVTLGVARQEMYKYEVSTWDSCYLYSGTPFEKPPWREATPFGKAAWQCKS